MTRIYDFDSIMNFRDFGNYPAGEGRHVKAGKLFRSAHFNQASGADLEKLAALGIALVVDLRHKPERDRQPNRWPETPAPTVLQYPDPEDSTDTLAPHEIFIKETLSTPEEARAYMQGSYELRPEDDGFKMLFSQTLKFMAKTGSPILIHCAAGKDRTGTLAAVILSALGVPFETIMDDYMMTMKAVDIESFLEPASQNMAKRYGRAIAPDALRPLFHVEPSYLNRSMATISDADSYIASSLNITPDERRALHAHYLDDGYERSQAIRLRTMSR